MLVFPVLEFPCAVVRGQSFSSSSSFSSSRETERRERERTENVFLHKTKRKNTLTTHIQSSLDIVYRCAAALDSSTAEAIFANFPRF